MTDFCMPHKELFIFKIYILFMPKYGIKLNQFYCFTGPYKSRTGPGGLYNPDLGYIAQTAILGVTTGPLLGYIHVLCIEIYIFIIIYT